MARKQIRLFSDDRYPEVEKAADAYVEARDERADLSRKETQKRLELLAVMRAHKLKKYKFADNSGEILEAFVDDGEPKVGVRKTGEAESEIGEGVPSSGGDDRKPAGMDGLIAEAMKAQDNAGVEVSSDGDVTVPDKAAPKKGKKGKAKKS